MSKRNWLVLKVPKYSMNPLVDPNGVIWSDAEFTQLNSHNEPGGTLARRLLTKEEAHNEAMQHAELERDTGYDGHYRYFPVELTEQYFKTVAVSSIVERL